MASGDRRHVVGRGAELAVVRSCLQHAAEGRSHTLVVTGTPGIGKTTLVREVVATAAEKGFLVLSGTCLPLQELSVPLQPLRSALRESAAPDRRDYLAATEVTDQAPRALDAYLDEVTATRPVVLFVDDLHWADQSTLDVLLYLAAGPRDRPLALVVAARDEVLPDGHSLHRWRADVERLPDVSHLHLRPLDREGTEQQLMALLGVAPHQSLVDDAFVKGGGNPYCTHLLVRGLSPTARMLPDDLPADLKAAVKRDWHELGESARSVTSLVAVAGGPVTGMLLEAVAADLGIGEVLPALEEAVGRRVLHLADPAGYWFHHPLQAEVLEADLGAARRSAWHAAYARHLESAAAGTEPSLPDAMALSDHHHRAGDEPAAYAWAMRAWQVAGSARGSPELRRLLRRAIELRPRVPEAAESREELLELLRGTAEASGAFDEQLVAVEALLACVEEREQPLRAGWLRVQRSRLQNLTGAGTPRPAEARAAVELTAIDPTSWQHAFALAELARTTAWAADPDAGEHARRAVAIARRSGHSRALAFALASRAMVSLDVGERATATRYAREAIAVALEDRDWHGYQHATTWEMNAAAPQVSRAVADLVRRRRVALAAAGAPHVYVAMMAAYEAEKRLLIGDSQACRDLLRISLGTDPGAFVDVRSRLTAAMLDAFQGRTAQAGMQLERATELLTGSRAHTGVALATATSVVALASGRPEDALRAALDGARAPGAPPHLCEWLVPLAARAIADLTEPGRAPAAGDAIDIDDLVRELPGIVVDMGEDPAQPQLRTMQEWYDAEVARARAAGDTADRFWRVAESGEAAELPWVAVYAWWRAAESLLARGPADRRRGIDAWRRADRMAHDLGARAILDETATLGRIARVPAPRDTAASATAVAGPLPGLTVREREILGHLVEGLTYAEIAAALVISEKTVSSHVSNLLRKTGTSNRVELSRLVTRAAADH